MAIANRVRAEAQAPTFRTQVKLRLVELNLSVSELARRLGLARNTVSLAINHETMFPTVKERISKELGL